MKRAMQKFVWGSAVTTAALLLTAPARAQEPVTVLLLDRNSIQAGVEPTNFPPAGINTAIADIGVRDALPFFNARVGQQLTLPAGSLGHEGFLAFVAVPPSWDSTAGEGDGLDNFVYAGPGLGSPDGAGSRVSRLAPTSQIAPLRDAGLQLLTGRTVCAVAYLDEIPRSASGASLAGPSLGVVAFSVLGVSDGDSTTLPSVVVSVRDTRETCSGNLMPMADAPVSGL